LPAGENGLRGTVQFIDMAALRTLARSIPGIDKDHGNSGECGFVRDKLPELGEGPAVQNRPLIAPSSDPRTNPGEFFQDYRLLRASGVFNDLFRNYVVSVFGKARFLARKLLQPAFCGAGLFALQFGAQAAMLSFTLLESFNRSSIEQNNLKGYRLKPVVSDLEI
jgi:hypothetical protein